jgi:proteasome lid subunit RPN8/RPN11
MSDLRLPVSIYEALVAHARAAVPIEACGILAGTGNQVRSFHAMTNTDASTDHFMMDPREQFAVAKAIRAAGQQMLAVHHSHPATPARPSAEDIRLARTPDVVYTILSLAPPEPPRLRGFRIEGTSVDEVSVTLTSDREDP